jgi:hypothetical protein
VPFKPAKIEALRSFVVLDSEAVLSGLSALDGGAVDEILTRTTDENASQLGGHVGGRAAKAQGGKNRGRKVEEELRRRRTEHSAAAALIDRLSEMDAIGEVDGALDEDVAGALTPGDTIRVRGEVLLHPLHQVDAMLRSFLKAAPVFDEKAAAEELRKTLLPMWEAMVGSGNSARILFDLATATPQVPRVLVPVKRSALQVESADVAGYGAMLAKVDRIMGPDEHLLAFRVLQNAPVSELERSAVEEGAVGMVEGFSEMGIPCTRDDLIMQGPLVMLRPLCVWR